MVAIKFHLNYNITRKMTIGYLYAFLRVPERSPRHVHTAHAKEKLFITSKALHRRNEIVNHFCTSHVEAANQFLCCGNWSFWREVSFVLLQMQHRKIGRTHIL